MDGQGRAGSGARVENRSRSTLRSPLLLLALATVAAGPADDCREKVLTTQASPSGSWIARVIQRACPSVMSDGDDITDVVSLGAAGGHATDVLAVFALGDPIAPPQPAWSGDTRLEIALPNHSIVRPIHDGVGPVKIVTRFVPDDPADRAAWRRAHHLSPP